MKYKVLLLAHLVLCSHLTIEKCKGLRYDNCVKQHITDNIDDVLLRHLNLSTYSLSLYDSNINSL